jgi:hypothetical protein
MNAVFHCSSVSTSLAGIGAGFDTRRSAILMTRAFCSSLGTDVSSSSVLPVSSFVPAIWVRTSWSMFLPRWSSRWMTRSDWPVLVAVSAVKRGVCSSHTLRPAVCWFNEPTFVSGCSASYASFLRRYRVHTIYWRIG